ncbi:uncharacterized protein LOC125779954 [Bactrocera dorsalis]|uniref:Uncharacterized protein LOC125779954 n=1 Tax=Bactrocera dorsalis TaxID=27457 RepID=A0ABM3K6T3_BACDO|nr:uncharacterized protein LOC125779954 [Bactrocera dorsalis]
MENEQTQMAAVNLVEELARREQQLEQMRQAYLELRNRTEENNSSRHTSTLIKTVNDLPIFTGTGEISINSFFSSIEYLLSTTNDAELQKEVTRTIYYRTIQGEAKSTIINIPQPDNWQLIKETLKLRYRPEVEPHHLYKKIGNLKIWIMWTVIALMTQHCNGTINVTEIKEQNGFIDLQIRDQAIPKDSDIVLHIIDIQQLENIVNAMTDNNSK